MNLFEVTFDLISLLILRLGGQIKEREFHHFVCKVLTPKRDVKFSGNIFNYSLLRVKIYMDQNYEKFALVKRKLC